MINLGSKNLGRAGWKDQNIISDDILKNIYGK